MREAALASSPDPASFEAIECEALPRRFQSPFTVLRDQGVLSETGPTSSTQAAGQKTYKRGRHRAWLLGTESLALGPPALHRLREMTALAALLCLPTLLDLPEDRPRHAYHESSGCHRTHTNPNGCFRERVAKKRGHGRTVGDLEGITFRAGSAAGMTPMDSLRTILQ